MYSGKEQTVALPKEGHLHILKNGYVYWEDDGKWDKTLGRPRDSRRSIGKLDPDDPERMYPNKVYHELFGSSEPPGLFSKTLSYGCYSALRGACSKIGCLEVLQEIFPGDWERILALAIHSICAENSRAQDYPYWAFHNYAGLSKPISDEEISVLYERLADEPERIGRFLSRFREKYEEIMPSPKERCLAFDSTNQSTASRGTKLAEWGHAKKNDKLPQINTALFTDESTGIPLFYEHFIGSVLDKTETPYTLEKAQELGFKKLFVMMDRGYYSAKVAREFDGENLEFAVMTPQNTKIVQTMLDDYSREIFNQEKYYLRSEGVYGIHAADMEALGGKYDVYLYYDSNRANDERNHIHHRIDFMVTTLMNRKRYTKKMETAFSPWLTVQKTDEADPVTKKKFSVTVNSSYVQQELADAGFFVIVSNAGLDADTMIRLARMRDTDEKAFKRIKSHFGLTSPYTHSNAGYEGKMFMTFIALVIIEAYKWYEKDVLKSRSSTTIATTLGELSKYQITRKSDQSWMPLYAVSKKQNEILEAVGISETDLESNVRELTDIV